MHGLHHCRTCTERPSVGFFLRALPPLLPFLGWAGVNVEVSALERFAEWPHVGNSKFLCVRGEVRVKAPILRSLRATECRKFDMCFSFSLGLILGSRRGLVLALVRLQLLKFIVELRDLFLLLLNFLSKVVILEHDECNIFLEIFCHLFTLLTKQILCVCKVVSVHGVGGSEVQQVVIIPKMKPTRPDTRRRTTNQVGAGALPLNWTCTVGTRYEISKSEVRYGTAKVRERASDGFDTACC